MRMTQLDRVRWHVMYKFGWSIGDTFTIEGLYNKLNGLGMNDKYHSTTKYLKVSRSTVRRAVEKMLVSGEIVVVKKNYHCYSRIQYKLVQVYPF